MRENSVSMISLCELVDKIPVTLRGFNKMQDELRRLKTVERPAVIAAIAEARELGDLSENAEYHAAKDKQGMIEARINDIEAKISLAEIVDTPTIKADDVRFGATVKFVDCETDKVTCYQIVGSDEADIPNGLLPITAPLATAFISKRVGDVIEVKTPGGIKSYEILEIKYE